MDQAEEYVKRVLKVLIYIEANIDEELTMEGLAKLACYSPFHFHRVFQAIVGETIHQYVKRLRIQRAAGKLRHTNQPITEIALGIPAMTPLRLLQKPLSSLWAHRLNAIELYTLQ